METKLIRERAEERFPINYKTDNSEVSFNQGNRQLGYVEGATTQQDIDIQRACEWLSNKLQQDSLGETYLYFKYCDEQDFINDFIQAMKGE